MGGGGKFRKFLKLCLKRKLTQFCEVSKYFYPQGNLPTLCVVAAACVSAVVRAQERNSEYCLFVLLLSLIMAKVMPKHVDDLCSK